MSQSNKDELSNTNKKVDSRVDGAIHRGVRQKVPSSWLKVYRLLITGHSQTKVAKILGISKQAVNKITKELVKNKYIKPLVGQNPILYTKGNNSHEIHEIALSTEEGERGVCFELPCRVHHIAVKYDVVTPPTKTIPWDGTWSTDGVEHHSIRIPMEQQVALVGEERKATITYHIGKNKSSIIIAIPQRWVYDAETLKKTPEQLTRVAEKIAGWLEDKFGFKFGDPKFVQNIHYGFSVSREIAEAAVKSGLRSDISWIDCSNGCAEVETMDLNRAIAIMTLPERVERLERIVECLDREVQELKRSKVGTSSGTDTRS